MIGPGRYRYWTYPSAVLAGSVAVVPRLALQAALPLAPTNVDRAVTNRYEVNFFQSQFRPRAKSVEASTEHTRSVRPWQGMLQWTNLNDFYTFSFTFGLAGHPIQGRHQATTLRLPAEATIAQFSEAVSHFLGFAPTAIPLLYDAPRPLAVPLQVINSARLGQMEPRRSTALSSTTLAAFFFTTYTPLIQVVYHQLYDNHLGL